MVRYLLIILPFWCATAHGQANRQALFHNSAATAPVNLDTTNPSNLIGLWRADTLVTLSGSNVSAWQSVVGAGNYLTNATAGQQPLLVSGVYNGKPTVRFNNAAYHLTITGEISNILLLNGNNISVFLVCKNASADDGNLFGTYNGGGWMVYGNGNRYTGSNGFAGTLTSRPSITPVSSALVLMEFTATPTQVVTYANGIQTNSVTGDGGSISGGGSLAIGWYSNNTTRGLTSYDVSEIILYNKVLNTTERQQVENYLKNKYGL